MACLGVSHFRPLDEGASGVIGGADLSDNILIIVLTFPLFSIASWSRKRSTASTLSSPCAPPIAATVAALISKPRVEGDGDAPGMDALPMLTSRSDDGDSASTCVGVALSMRAGEAEACVGVLGLLGVVLPPRLGVVSPTGLCRLLGVISPGAPWR